MLDLNNLGTVRQFGNTINSLFYETNLLKLYEKRFINLAFSQRITTGLETSFSAEWANRKVLQNTSNYTFRNLKDKKFTSNNPFTPDFDTPLFPENQSFKISLRAIYEFSKKYATYPNGKVYLPSKYPKLGVSYTKGLKNWFDSDVDYDLLSVDISKSDISLGLYGKTAFWLGGGKFLNDKSLFFSDYKHFIGVQTLGYKPQINTFLFLGLYNFSTPKEYFEGHLEHNFSGFFLNKIPLIRKLKLQEIAGLNFLATPSSKNYMEYYFGLKSLGFGINYGLSYSNGKRINKGFKITYPF